MKPPPRIPPRSTLALAFVLGATLPVHPLAKGYDVDGDGAVDFELNYEVKSFTIPPATSYVNDSARLVMHPGFVFLGAPTPFGYVPATGFGETVGTDKFPAIETTLRTAELETFTTGGSFGGGSTGLGGALHQGPFYLLFRKTAAAGDRFGWVLLGGGQDDQSFTVVHHVVSGTGLVPAGSQLVTTPEHLVMVSQSTDLRWYVSWLSGNPQAVVERTASLVDPKWEKVASGSRGSLELPSAEGAGFFRVR